MDWTISVDIGEGLYEFLPALAVTSLRPHLVAYSIERRVAIIIEMT